ncbi:Protein DDI1 2 [Nymphon striatum]|nr:Protein DDI1 2 [Nymphon striatum]
MDERVRRGTDHYIDDIVVRESVLSAQELREHLARYGLESKAPEGLDGGRVLGISLRKGSGGHLEMSRGMALSEIVMDQSRLTKRGLFSLCGRLVGHYPVAGWLRPCCSFLKRLGCGGSWDEPVESSVGELANELLVRARAEDPVRGRWHVSPHGTVTVWTDASSLGMGVALEVDGSVAEDASWLRKESDHRHINVAELEAVARGINLAISWGFKTFTVATDSRTVISWMDNTVEGHRRVRTKGASEMLIKRRLGVIRDTITEFGLTVTVRFVSTTENKADRMTRVPKKWLGHRYTGEEGADVSAALATGESVEDAIWAAHLPHHLGVDRTLYLARQIRRNLTREQVKRELVGLKNIDVNMETAMEYHPESFGQVIMLYIDCRVNGHPVKAFIDSGVCVYVLVRAQTTIMSQACAERCSIMRLVDVRWAGIAKGVGTQKIIGRVHLGQIQIGNDYLTSSFSILEDQPMDMLLGLDIKTVLTIGTTGTETPFLSESELPECARQLQIPSSGGPSSEMEVEDQQLVDAMNRSVNDASSSSSTSEIPSSDKFTDQDVNKLQSMGFERSKVLEELRKANGDTTKATAALFAKSFKF